jgi:hypothetical protein
LFSFFYSVSFVCSCPGSIAPGIRFKWQGIFATGVPWIKALLAKQQGMPSRITDWNFSTAALPKNYFSRRGIYAPIFNFKSFEIAAFSNGLDKFL